MWQQRSQALETRINTLHSSALVAVGDLASHALLIVHVEAASAVTTLATSAAILLAAETAEMNDGF